MCRGRSSRFKGWRQAFLINNSVATKLAAEVIDLSMSPGSPIEPRVVRVHGMVK